MAGSIGPLVPADEQFNHQLVETFASVGQSDPAWAEKVCGMAAARDGSVQIAFGFGKYTNRNVVDAYAGISRGTEQWAVRASRALHSDPATVDAGPISYEVLEPLRSVRVRLAANEVQPIAFDIVFTAVVPCVLEQREDRRDPHGYRRATDQIRYHQTGVASGWLEIDGVRTEVKADAWVATRDKSWGVRPQVGLPLADMEPDFHQSVPQVLAIWNPVLFARADGSTYAFHHYFLHFSGPGFSQQQVQGGFEDATGQVATVVEMQPELQFDPLTRRLQSGVFRLQLDDGSERPLAFAKLSETGFYLGAGHYHGGDGHYHGSWRGELFVDGDHVPDAAQPEVIERYTQFRDCMIQVEDPVGGGTGWGNCQTYVAGDWLAGRPPAPGRRGR